MKNEQIINYIKESRITGVSDEQIKQNLLAGGWQEADINEAFNPTPAPVAPPSVLPNVPAPTPQQPSVALSDNRGMAILAYLGILIVVPFLTGAKNDPFVKFHLKQGLVLIIFWIGVGILSSIFSYMLYAIGGFAFLLSLLTPLIYLGLLIINIIGLVNAASGKMSPLPIIGGFGDKFNL